MTDDKKAPSRETSRYLSLSPIASAVVDDLAPYRTASRYVSQLIETAEMRVTQLIAELRGPGGGRAAAELHSYADMGHQRALEALQRSGRA